MSLLLDRATTGKAEGNHSEQVPVVLFQGRHDNAADLRTSTNFHPTFLESKPLSRELSIRQNLLGIFCDPLPQHCLEFLELSPNQWRPLLRWLDISGLALYFFDRMTELQLGYMLPGPVLARLQQNLNDNTQRTRSMTAESIAIQQEFQSASVRYAALKGLSFWPNSVPKPELRSQFDLDFLVAEKDLQESRKALERRGYRLYGMSGRSWEFKCNEFPGIELKDMYKDTGSWAVELHVESGGSQSHSQLDRVEWRELSGFKMPVLSPVDLLLGQGLHAYKHICSEFSRAAHLLEFRRHVLFRSCDNSFWAELESKGAEHSGASQALGVVTQLITETIGQFAPDALTSWTSTCLSRPARLWVEMYGHRAVLGSFPGSKLYLLLKQEIRNSESSRKRSVRHSLIPSRLPPSVIRASANETFLVRIGRYRMQLLLIVGRLRFHLTEGLRFAWESRRWRRRLNQVAR
jgi:hypothetical protein